MDGYIVAGPPSTFRFQPNDSRTVRFPAIFALRVDLVRSVRVGAQDSLLRRTHESAVKTSSPTPELLPLLILSAPTCATALNQSPALRGSVRLRILDRHEPIHRPRYIGERPS